MKAKNARAAQSYEIRLCINSPSFSGATFANSSNASEIADIVPTTAIAKRVLLRSNRFLPVSRVAKLLL